MTESFFEQSVEGKITVGFVACDGVPVHGALSAQLMCTACFRGKFQKGERERLSNTAEPLVVGDSWEAAVAARGGAQLVVAIAELGEAVAPDSLREGQACALDDGVIDFGDATVSGTEELFDVCGEGVFCRGEDEAAGGRVNAVEEEEAQAVIELVKFTVEIVGSVEQRWFFIGRTVGVRCQTSGFFEGDEARVVLCDDAG